MKDNQADLPKTTNNYTHILIIVIVLHCFKILLDKCEGWIHRVL
jgi:hypothetical protein